MIIPKYVIEMMERAEFVTYGSYDPGYTIRIRKATPYTKIGTLKNEIEKLQKWIDRQYPADDMGDSIMVVNHIPSATHYCNQSAKVTIYDPIMQKLEKYIKGGL